LRLAKPDEAIYRAYEKATGVAGAEIIFFDDLAENIEAARAAGWNAEQIDHTGDTAEQVRMLLSRYGIELNHQSSRG
jgi:FMN phosphatase YigB (HAD superfamily)